MEVQRQIVTVPSPAPEQPRTPQLVQPRQPRPRRSLVWLLVPLVIAAGIGIHLLLRTDRAATTAGAAAVGEIPTARVDTRPLVKTVRATGGTQAERFASLVVPTLQGNRSGRGRQADNAPLVAVNSNVTVNSTSSVSRSSTATRLSPTGTLSSSAGEGSGSVSGAPRDGSNAMRASTSRVGNATPGRTGASSAGNVTTAGRVAETAMGQTGLGSTSSELRGGSQGPGAIGRQPGGGGGGGGGGGNRSRGGDFRTTLHKLIPAGTVVRKGDVVAEFDMQFMLLRLEDYRSSLAQKEAGLQKAKADMSVLRESHEQSIESAAGALEKATFDIKATPVLSKIDSERLKLGLEESDAAHKQLLSEVKPFGVSQEAELREAELQVMEAQSELRRAQNNVDKLLSKAPIHGMVVLMNVFRGGEFGQVREGDEIWGGMAFMQIVDPSSMMIDAKVNQVDVEKIRIGQEATVRFDAFPDLTLPARVHSIGTVAKARQFRQEYVKDVPVTLKLEKMDPRVIPDLSVSADIVVAREEKAAVIPLESVFRDDSREPYVYVKTPSGWVQRRVDLALSNHVEAGVRSGLENGQMVALARPGVASGPKRN